MKTASKKITKKDNRVYILMGIIITLVFFISLFVFLYIILGGGNVTKDKVLDSLPAYEDSEIYANSGDSELIKYGTYSYTGVTDEMLSENEYMTKISLSSLSELDIAAIDALYKAVERFDLMLGVLYDADSELIASVAGGFDNFDIGGIGSPNYFYVETVTSGSTDSTPSPDTCDKFTLYYFDVEAQTLHYFYADQKSINETVGG